MVVAPLVTISLVIRTGPTHEPGAAVPSRQGSDTMEGCIVVASPARAGTAAVAAPRMVNAARLFANPVILTPNRPPECSAIGPDEN